jgi:hypothetical protein
MIFRHAHLELVFYWRRNYNLIKIKQNIVIPDDRCYKKNLRQDEGKNK